MFTKTEIEYLNSIKVWNYCIEIILTDDVHDNDSFMLYKIKHKNKHFAINTKAQITNQIANKLESKLVQELHNNRISNK
tara:strand:+ start:193 stop:429 length:237 start_codon:yes stop_codon:yes gene_type:complete